MIGVGVCSSSSTELVVLGSGVEVGGLGVLLVEVEVEVSEAISRSPFTV